MARDERIALFKTIGSTQIGLGHVSRCMTLIQALPSGWRGILMVENDPLVHQFAKSAEIELLDTSDVSILENERLDILFLDQLGQHWDALQKAPFYGNYRRIGLDYFNYEDPQVDIIINLFNQAREQPSSDIDYHEGLRFALIASRFEAHRKRDKESRERVETVLIMMGGADPLAKTCDVLKFLNQRPTRFKVNIIVGPLCPHVKAINAIALESPHSVQVYKNPDNLLELMAASDLAISGCGTTLFELSYLGVPAIVLAQNSLEKKFCSFVEKEKVALCAQDDLEAAWKQMEPLALRKTLMRKQLDLFDGRGASRILETSGIRGV